MQTPTGGWRVVGHRGKDNNNNNNNTTHTLSMTLARPSGEHALIKDGVQTVLPCQRLFTSLIDCWTGLRHAHSEARGDTRGAGGGGGKGGGGRKGEGGRGPPHRMSCQRDWQGLDVVAKEKFSACGGKNLDGFRVLKFTVSWMWRSVL